MALDWDMCARARPLQGVQLVSFDAGGTLLGPHTSVGGVFADLLRPHGLSLDPQRLEATFTQVIGAMPKALPGKVSEAGEQAYWSRVVSETVSLCAGPGRLSPSAMDKVAAGFNGGAHWRLRLGVPLVLERLRERGYKLALVTNSARAFERTLADLDLPRHFDLMLFSVDIGYAKPSCELFHEVERRMGSFGIENLHVGTSLEEDFDGARASGWQALLLRSDGKPVPEVPQIDDLRWLLELLPDVPGAAMTYRQENLIAEFRSLPHPGRRAAFGEDGRAFNARDIVEAHYRPGTHEAKPIADIAWKLGRRFKLGEARPEFLIEEHWIEIIGDQYASQCRMQRIAADVLLITASTPIVVQELMFRRKGILQRVRQYPGLSKLRDIRVALG